MCQKSRSCHPGLDPGSHTKRYNQCSMSWRIKSAMTKQTFGTSFDIKQISLTKRIYNQQKYWLFCFSSYELKFYNLEYQNQTILSLVPDHKQKK